MLKAIDDVIDSPDTCNHRQQGFITYSDSKRNWKSCRLVMICSGLQTAGACVFALCSAGIMQKLPIDATGPRSAFRAWGVLCGVRVLPQSPEPRAPLRFSLTRVSRGQNTRRCHPCCICTLPTPRRMSLPTLAAASMVISRCHRGAMGSVCVGRAVRCSDMRVSPQSPQHDNDSFR